MNRKLILKLTLDVIMTVLMLVLFAYPVTGNLIHEVIGIVLFALFALHLVLNRAWYRSLLKKKTTLAARLSLAVNLLLTADMLLLLITSVGISHTAFAFLNLIAPSWMVQAHITSAYWGLVLLSVHIGLHWGMILNAARKMTGIQGKSPMRTALARLVAVLLVVYGIYSSFTNQVGAELLPLPETLLTGTSQVETAAAGAETMTLTEHTDSSGLGKRTHGGDGEDSQEQQDDKSQQTSTATSAVQTGETLQDYLGRLTCTGCSRHCSLLAPQCGTGTVQAQEATAVYEAAQQETASDGTDSTTGLSDSTEGTERTAEVVTIEAGEELMKQFSQYGSMMSVYVGGTYYLLKLVPKKKKDQ